MRYKTAPFGEIPSHWQIKSIEEIAEVVTDYVANGSFASLKNNVQYLSEPDYAVLIRLVDFNKSFSGDFVYINKSSYDFLKKSQLIGGEIIISNVGANVGTVFKTPNLNMKMALAPNSVMLRTKYCDDFYFHWLKSRYGQHMISAIISGSAQPKFNKTEFRKMLVPVPPIEEQREIANILNSYDKKIQLNKQINHHLEEMIDAIFLRYIESSKQLEVKKLGELFDTKTATFNPAKASEEKVNHFSLPAFDASQYPLVDETNNIKSNKNIIKEYSVLFSKLNPSTKRVWVPFTNQDLISVCSTEFVSLAGKDKIEQAILFAIINSQIFQDYFVAHATGTTNSRQRTKPSVAYEFEIPYNKNLLYQLGRTLSPLLTQLEDNLHQIHKITQIRNELLPKLLSGELSVTQAAK